MRGSDTGNMGGSSGGSFPSESRRENARPYAAPRLIRVRVETSRMKLGYYDAVQYCTIHDHDVGINPCTIN